MGFASLFRGRYTGDVDKEWLISLTAAPATSGPAPGQAAPVTNARPRGSATFPASTKPERDAVKAREEKIVRHQFLILFSPLSAIFVYQMLVAANTASQPLAVAVAMLGAGPVLNALLDKAVTTAQGFVSK